MLQNMFQKMSQNPGIGGGSAQPSGLFGEMMKRASGQGQPLAGLPAGMAGSYLPKNPEQIGTAGTTMAGGFQPSFAGMDPQAQMQRASMGWNMPSQMAGAASGMQSQGMPGQAGGGILSAMMGRMGGMKKPDAQNSY